MTGNVAVDALMMLAQENSSEKRRELLHAVTDLFLASVPTNDAQSALFDDVMTRVASEAGVDGRRDLSVRIAPIDTAPRGIVNQLARDEDISVAGPVLTQSNVLSGDDLVQIAETKGQQHMSAISERQSISSIVTDVLIRRGNHTVLRNVSGNEGAELSENGARTLSEKAVQDAEIQRNLYRRSDLPEAVAKAVHSRGDVAVDRPLPDAGRVGAGRGAALRTSARTRHQRGGVARPRGKRVVDPRWTPGRAVGRDGARALARRVGRRRAV